MRSLIILMLCCSFCCNQEMPVKFSSLTFHFSPFNKGTIYLEKVGLNDGNDEIVDSAVVKYGDEMAKFKILNQEEGIFQLRLKFGTTRIISFINQTQDFEIFAKNRDWSGHYFKNSTLNSNFLHFISKESALKESIVVKKNSKGENLRVYLQNDEKLRTDVQNLRISYADTTGSPGIFLLLFNEINFGKDYTALKKFIIKAERRFPNHRGIERLKILTVRYVSIFENEYNVGDILPELILPNEKNELISLRSFHGKYLFVDFWSSWCPQCLDLEFKKSLKEQYATQNFEVINIALDSEKDIWRKIATHYSNSGVQLLDTMMWQGKTIETFKIDSIPFNYVLKPDGSILAKAVKKDSIKLILDILFKSK